jgi:hypothetical protein
LREAATVSNCRTEGNRNEVNVHPQGDGGWLGNELVADDPTLARLCSDAFEAVWALATPHDKYSPA